MSTSGRSLRIRKHCQERDLYKGTSPRRFHWKRSSRWCFTFAHISFFIRLMIALVIEVELPQESCPAKKEKDSKIETL